MSLQNPNPESRQPQSVYHPQEEEIDLREQVNLYLRHWPWFILGILICLLGAFLYLRYTVSVYNNTATIIIKDEEKKGALDLSAFSEMGMFGGLATSSIENEIGILQSRRLMSNVARNLQLNVRYFEEGTVKTTELYADVPFKVQLLEYNEAALGGLGSFSVEILDEETYRISNTELELDQKVSFGAPLELPFGKIILTPNFEAGKEQMKNTIVVSFGTVEGAADSYRNALEVMLTGQQSTLIELSLQDPVREKARDILNRLIYQYNQEAIEDKNQVSLNTAEFIEERLVIIAEELDSVETGKEDFKTANRLTDIQAEAQLFIQNASEFRKEQMEVETQLELANAMLDYLNNAEKEGELLPSNLGFSEGGLVSAIATYNQIVLERNRILAGSTELNPVIVNLDAQIEQMKGNVMTSLMNYKNSLQISQRELAAQEATINREIADVPSQEKQFRVIERQQSVKEALYLFLLQKREETNLALAAVAPKAKIVDAAYSSNNPVSPKPKIIGMAALVMGLVIPFLIIYVRNLLNNTVKGRGDLEKHAREIPIVGEIPRIPSGQPELVERNDRTILAESFRILHTNLQYLLVNAGKKPGGNTIFVTSTIKGEGKTFAAFNLAMTLANAEKRVLVIGADLRNPQLQRFEPGIKENLGVSDYLVSETLDLRKVIQTSRMHENLDLLVSGTIPPNPSELWRQEKATTLFSELTQMYDYLIVDTAPAMLVTDTFLINKFADITLYMVRAGFTEKKLLNFAMEAKHDGKIHDVGFVLNDVEAANFGYGNSYSYGYSYGYAYGPNKLSFWDRVKGRFGMF